MVLLYLAIVGAIGFIIWKTCFDSGAPGLIRTIMTPFAKRGDEVRPGQLMEQLKKMKAADLRRQGVYFEFYPNHKIVALIVPSQAPIYCQCNLMEYLDVTRAVEKQFI